MPNDKRSRYSVVFILLTLLFSCTFGEGEGPRYTGPVISVDKAQLCLGPNTSSPTITCGVIPEGVTRLPRVGACVSLFGHPFDHGTKIRWSRSDLGHPVDDKECQRSSPQSG